jgi:hypothetical protein
MVWNESLVKEKVYDVMKILNINRMPTSNEIRNLHMSSLDAAINIHCSGYINLAKELNLAHKVKDKKWKYDNIKQRIYEIMNELNINRMPSQSEILLIEKNNSLCVAIHRSLSFYGWAKELGLDIKDSETLMGISFQEICSQELIRLGYIVENTTIKATYDLLINNNIKIDVKSGCAYYDSHGSRIHAFGINKKFPTCDLYIIYALDENGIKIERTFIIPSKNLKLITMCIGKDSKYNKYIDQWDYIQQYDQFYKQLN